MLHCLSSRAGHRRLLLAAALACGAASTALANNVGENVAWQFQTSADKVNQAAVQDLMQKRRSGYYAAPVYNTYIDRQYNCDLSANATGNHGTNSTVANSPGTSGANANATGNDNATDVGNTGSSTVGSGQANSGTVGAGIHGGTSSYVSGYASQALNSNQTNSGNQSASVSGSSACVFGALN